MVRTLAAFVLCLALFAAALWLAMTTAADAHTLPMAGIKSRIEASVRKQFTIRVIMHLQGCRRIDEHGGQCVVRLYTMPYRDKYCGIGYSQMIGGKVRTRGIVKPCPEPRGMPYGGLTV